MTIKKLPLNLYQIEHRVRRFWRFFSEQTRRGKTNRQAKRIAHLKLAPELRDLPETDRGSVLSAIELSE